MPELVLMLAFLDLILNITVVVLGIGLLIFVHELGHFLVAKWNGVRVEAFSLGFGPVLWGFRRGDTHYRLSLVPLGGYVKMAGETVADGVTDDPAEFVNKPILARAAVLVAGVVMNAIIAIVLFIIAFNVGVPLVVPVAGGVHPAGSAAAAGIRAGDRIVRIGDKDVVDFHDVMEEIAYADGPVDILVNRNGEEILLTDVKPTKHASGLIQMIGIEPPYEPDIFVDEDSAGAEAGLKTGDELLGVAGIMTTDPSVIQHRMNFATLPIEFAVKRDGQTHMIPVTPRFATLDDPIAGISPAQDTVAGFWWGSKWAGIGVQAGDRFFSVNGKPALTIGRARELAQAAAPGPVTFVVEREKKEISLDPVTGIETSAAWQGLFDQVEGRPGRLDSTRISLVDSRRFQDGNPAANAGLPEGAVITKVGATETKEWADVHKAIRAVSDDEPVTMTYTVDGQAEMTLEVARRHVVRRLFGLSFERQTEKVTRSGLVASVGAGLRRSVNTGMGILRMLGGIITGKVSAKALGGPVAIAQISYRSAKKNIIHFLYFLGILSINLAILNILPIPVLDGGHLFFLLIEAIRRKPLPDRVVGMFHWAGFLFLILVMVFVIFNDIERNIG